MRRTTFVLAFLGLSLVACGDKGDDTAGGDDSGGPVDDGQTPSVTEADAWCALNTTGEQAYYWWARFTADDPQGTDTLESFVLDGLDVMSGDTLASSQAIVCDESGSCSASFSEEGSGISCSAATSYTFVFAVEDEDGNRSADYEVAGRQGSDANG